MSGHSSFARSGSRKVNIPPFDVRTDECHSHSVSDVEAPLARHQFPFDRRFEEPDPRAFI